MLPIARVPKLSSPRALPDAYVLGWHGESYRIAGHGGRRLSSRFQYADESNPGGCLSENLEKLENLVNLVAQHDFSRHLVVGKTEPVEIRLISLVLIGEPCLQPISKPIK